MRNRHEVSGESSHLSHVSVEARKYEWGVDLCVCKIEFRFLLLAHTLEREERHFCKASKQERGGQKLCTLRNGLKDESKYILGSKMEEKLGFHGRVWT